MRMFVRLFVKRRWLLVMATATETIKRQTQQLRQEIEKMRQQ